MEAVRTTVLGVDVDVGKPRRLELTLKTNVLVIRTSASSNSSNNNNKIAPLGGWSQSMKKGEKKTSRRGRDVRDREKGLVGLRVAAYRPTTANFQRS